MRYLPNNAASGIKGNVVDQVNIMFSFRSLNFTQSMASYSVGEWIKNGYKISGGSTSFEFKQGSINACKNKRTAERANELLSMTPSYSGMYMVLQDKEQMSGVSANRNSAAAKELVKQHAPKLAEKNLRIKITATDAVVTEDVIACCSEHSSTICKQTATSFNSDLTSPMPVKSGNTTHIVDSTYYQIYNSGGVEFFADDSSAANAYINLLVVAPSCGMKIH